MPRRLRERRIKFKESPRVKHPEAFRRAIYEVDFVNEAGYEISRLNSRARDCVQQEENFDSLFASLEESRRHVKHIAEVSPRNVRAKWLPRIMSLYKDLMEAYRKVRERAEAGEEEEALEILRVDGQCWVLLSEAILLHQKALIERYEELTK